MKLAIIIALATSAVVTVPAPALAREGCGIGLHRGPAGRCIRNVRGAYYKGYGYWDGKRYWKSRYRYHGGWRYR